MYMEKIQLLYRNQAAALLRSGVKDLPVPVSGVEEYGFDLVEWPVHWVAPEFLLGSGIGFVLIEWPVHERVGMDGMYKELGAAMHSNCGQGCQMQNKVSVVGSA